MAAFAELHGQTLPQLVIVQDRVDRLARLQRQLVEKSGAKAQASAFCTPDAAVAGRRRAAGAGAGRLDYAPSPPRCSRRCAWRKAWRRAICAAAYRSPIRRSGPAAASPERYECQPHRHRARGAPWQRHHCHGHQPDLRRATSICPRAPKSRRLRWSKPQPRCKSCRARQQNFASGKMANELAESASQVAVRGGDVVGQVVAHHGRHQHLVAQDCRHHWRDRLHRLPITSWR